jgi:hypothetical protein
MARVRSSNRSIDSRKELRQHRLPFPQLLNQNLLVLLDKAQLLLGSLQFFLGGLQLSLGGLQLLDGESATALAQVSWLLKHYRIRKSYHPTLSSWERARGKGDGE